MTDKVRVYNKCSYCGKENVYAKGLCRNCYERTRKNGLPIYKDRLTDKTKEIIEACKTEKSDAKLAKMFNTSRQYVYLVRRRYYKPTNADRIRAMTDEELAELIPNLQDKDLDSLCPPKGSCYKDGGCKACWLEWLRKEVDDG